MKLYEIKDILNARVLSGEEDIDKIIIAAGGGDTLVDIMASVTMDSLLLTGLVDINLIMACCAAGVGSIAFVRGKKIARNVIDTAKLYDIPVLLTDYSMFVSCGRLYMNGLRGTDGASG